MFYVLFSFYSEIFAVGCIVEPLYTASQTDRQTDSMMPTVNYTACMHAAVRSANKTKQQFNNNDSDRQ